MLLGLPAPGRGRSVVAAALVGAVLRRGAERERRSSGWPRLCCCSWSVGAGPGRAGALRARRSWRSRPRASSPSFSLRAVDAVTPRPLLPVLLALLRARRAAGAGAGRPAGRRAALPDGRGQPAARPRPGARARLRGGALPRVPSARRWSRTIACAAAGGAIYSLHAIGPLAAGPARLRARRLRRRCPSSWRSLAALLVARGPRAAARVDRRRRRRAEGGRLARRPVARRSCTTRASSSPRCPRRSWSRATLRLRAGRGGATRWRTLVVGRCRSRSCPGSTCATRRWPRSSSCSCWPRGRPAVRAVAVLAAAATSAVALGLYHFALYGFFDPRRVCGRRPEFSLAHAAEGLPGPAARPGVRAARLRARVRAVRPRASCGWRATAPAGAGAALALAAVVVAAAPWPMWRGGFNPPARFLVPLAAGAGARAGRARSGAARARAARCSWAGASGPAPSARLAAALVHRDRDGTAPLFRAWSGAEEWTRLLPGYVLDESAGDRGRAGARVGRGRSAGGGGRGAATPPTAAGLAAASAGAASSPPRRPRRSRSARTGGRDAVRVVGRPAVRVPGWALTRAADGVWGHSRTCGWGPLYEPHRHPDGRRDRGALAAAGRALPDRARRPSCSGRPIAAPRGAARGRSRGTGRRRGDAGSPGPVERLRVPAASAGRDACACEAGGASAHGLRLAALNLFGAAGLTLQEVSRTSA